MPTDPNELGRHIGPKYGGSGLELPHPTGTPVVESTSRITASRENEFQFISVKAIPGTSASILYVCLGDNANPTVYSWVQVATG